MSHRLRCRYGAARGRGAPREKVLADALRDWRSGRAFFKERAGRPAFWLRPLERRGGVITVGFGRAKMAPWSKLVVSMWPDDPAGGLALEARRVYPDEPRTDFERLHALDPVRVRLLHEMGKEIP